MKSWKTLVGGLLITIGMPLQSSDDSTIHTIGVIMTSVGGLVLGIAAKDSDVTGAGKNARTE